MLIMILITLLLVLGCQSRLIADKESVSTILNVISANASRTANTLSQDLLWTAKTLNETHQLQIPDNTNISVHVTEYISKTLIRPTLKSFSFKLQETLQQGFDDYESDLEKNSPESKHKIAKKHAFLIEKKIQKDLKRHAKESWNAWLDAQKNLYSSPSNYSDSSTIDHPLKKDQRLQKRLFHFEKSPRNRYIFYSIIWQILLTPFWSEPIAMAMGGFFAVSILTTLFEYVFRKLVFDTWRN